MSKDLDTIDDYDPDLSLHVDNRQIQPQPAVPAQAKPRRKQTTTQAAPADDADEQPKRGWQRLVAFFTDDRLRIFLAVTLVLLSLFVVIAAVSYFKYGPQDQSIIENTTLKQAATGAQGHVKNVAGPFGAWLSKALLCDGFGVGALVLIVYCWILALGLVKLRKCRFWATTFHCLLVGISLSIVLGLVTYTMDLKIYLGGVHGHYINKLLIDYGSIFAALGVSALLVVAVVLVYLGAIRRALRKVRSAKLVSQMQTQLQRDRQSQLSNIDDNPQPDVAVAAAVPTQPDAPAEEKDTPPTAETITFDIDEPHDANDGGGTEVFTVEAPQIEEAKEIKTGNPAVEKNGLFDHRAELSYYKFPELELLEDRPAGQTATEEELQENKDRIVKTLLDYKIPIARIKATVGPTVTLYEIVPAEGVRIAQIKRLEDDIALTLAALGIRIIAPIPGKGTVGIEVPNRYPQTVSMRSVLASKKYQESKMALPMAMGVTISNEIFMADLTKMPHLLVAGATGMGKSVGLNAILASLIYKKHPSELKFVLIDPKMVEFSLYSKLERHYLAKLPEEEDAIITDMNKVIQTLNSLCVEMDNRYELLRNAGVRSLEEYNNKFTNRLLNPEKGHKYLPYIVVVVDEFADLIMTAGKEVETPIARIAQKARAVGIHLIIATQRPSTNVITGIIKANFPGRIAFRVNQMVDSKTILDRTGAQQLIGKGDMLFSHNGTMERVQCAFISTEEVEAINEWIDNQAGYPSAYPLPEYIPEAGDGPIAGASTERDTLFDEAARFVVNRQQGSTSSLQRQFGIGYNRAGKLMDQMEAAGIVGPVCGSKPRAILVDGMTLEHILNP